MTIKQPRPNQRAALDAGSPSGLHFVRLLPGPSEHDRSPQLPVNTAGPESSGKAVAGEPQNPLTIDVRDD